MGTDKKKKIGVPSVEAKKLGTGDEAESVMVWTISFKGKPPYEFVATEAEAEDERAKFEKDSLEEGKKGKATKKAVRVAEGYLLEHYRKFGTYIVGEEADDTGESEEEPADEAPETFTEAEEKLAAETLEKLRAAEKPLTVAELHPETNEEGSAGYVAAGQIDKVLRRLLVPRGLAAQDGEAFVAVAPGVLAQRRGELLAAVVRQKLENDVFYPIEDARSANDLAALETAGLVKIAGDFNDGASDASAVVSDETAESVLTRGAIAIVEDALPDCRESGAAVVVDGDAGAALAKAERLRKELEAKLENTTKDLAVTREGLSARTQQVETLRGWFRTNGMPFPLDKPEVPKPAREEFMHTICVTPEVKGRMYDLRRVYMARLADAESTFKTAKSHYEGSKETNTGKIKALDDASSSFYYYPNGFRRVDLQRGVVQIVHAEDESWVLEEKELRSEQLEAEKAKAEEAAKPAPAAVAPPPGAGDAMRIIPPGEEHGSEVAGTLAAAVASPGFAEKYATAIGKDVTVDTSGTVPVISVTDRPKPPPLTVPAIRAELEKLVAQLAEGETITIADASVRLARPVFGVEPGATFTDLVQTAAKSGHKASSIHWEAREGKEWIGAPHLPKKAPVVQTAEEKLLAKIRAAGADGIPPSDLATDEEKSAFKVLKERGAVERNGKPGRGSRIVAKEHATNGASAEASS